MAQKLCDLIEHDDKRIRMGANAVETAESYNKNLIMKKWIELFDSL